MIMTTAQIMVDIFQKVIPLTVDQIWVYGERREIPPEKGLYAVVGYNSAKPFNTSRKQISGNSGLVEERSVVVQEQLYVKIFSADYSAAQQYPDFLGCFSSNYAQEMQEKYQFKLFTVPVSVVGIPDIDGSGIVRQFVVTFNTHRGYTKSSNIAYYDTFTTPTPLNEKGTT
jgi:hypothetical protein